MYQNIYITRGSPGNPSTVLLWDDKQGMVSIPYYKFRYAYTPDPQGEYNSIHGHRVKKVTRWANHDLVFESDLSRETRVLTDIYLDSDEPSEGHVVGIYDIEVSSEGGFPDVEKADKEITSIAFYNREDEQYTVFVLDEKNKLDDRFEKNVEILRFDSERELLLEFIQWYSRQGFTILLGWNNWFFDTPYLFNRLRLILGQEKAHKLSPVGIVEWDKWNNRYAIAGVSDLDYLQIYKNFTYNEMPNYRLDTIGRHEVSMGKIEYEGTLDSLFEEDIEKFIEYNLTDVKIIEELDKKLNFLDLLRGICHMGHIPYDQFEKSSKFIEGTIVTYLHRKGIVCPNKPLGGKEEMLKRKESGDKGFKGAYVKVPSPGRYDWVYSLDLQSLYPSIIMGLNISPDKKFARVVDGFDNREFIRGSDKVVEVDVLGAGRRKMTYTDLKNFVESSGLTIASNGVMYRAPVDEVVGEVIYQNDV